MPRLGGGKTITMSYSPDIITPPFYGVEAQIGERELIVPALNLCAAGVNYVLRWDNSRVREFDQSEFDHVELTEADGSTSGIWAHEDMMEGMRQHLYPVLYMPYIDNDSYEWYIETVSKQLEKELGIE